MTHELGEFVDKRIEIVMPKKKGKTDSFFYDGEIACAKKKKFTLSLIAGGDICIEIDEKHRYTNRNVGDAITKYRLNDERLTTLERNGRLIWNNNNWFEVVLNYSGVGYSRIGDVTYDYDDAIRMLEQCLKKSEQDLAEIYGIEVI